MKRIYLWALLAMLGSGAGFGAQAATFKIASILPDGTSQMQAMRVGGKEIERLTEGRVNFKFYPGGVMGNDASVLRKMRIGQLQGGAFTSGTMAKFYPDAQIYSLPFLLGTEAEARYVRSLFDKEIFAGLEKAGLVPMGLATGGFAFIMSQQPIRTIADLDDKKVWLPQGDQLTEIALKEIGANAVPLTLGDVYTGLQTGLIDTVGTSPAGAIALQWYTQVKYVTNYSLGYLGGWLAIGKKAWAKISPADQKIVRQVWADVYAKIDSATWADADNAKAALLNNGLELVEVPQAAEAQWQAAVERSLAKAGEAGAYNLATLQRLRSALADFRAGQ